MTPPAAGRAEPERVLVLGAGLAGLATATALAEQGVPVTLLEGRGRPGGRTMSFSHRATGDELDTGQHVLMGCYVETFRLLDRIGARDLVRLQDGLEVELRTADGRRGSMSSRGLSGALGQAVALLGHGLLSPRERLACLRVLGDARWRCADPALERITVEQWLVGLGQSRNARDALWTPLCLATLNASPRDAAASLLAVVLVRALLGGGRSAAIGVPRVGLSRLFAEPAARTLRELGGRIELNQPVVSLEVAGGEPARATGVRLREGRFLPARRVVSAVPAAALHRLLPDELRARAPFESLPEMRPSPIVSLHLWLDRPVLDVPFLGFVGTQLHWAFDREATWSQPARGGHLVTLVVSGADDFAASPRERIFETCWAEMQGAVPNARGARVLEWEVVKERAATFRGAPGIARCRFGPRTPVEGLLVAGDWTATGLPATMEGACASGHAAAREVLDALGASGAHARDW